MTTGINFASRRNQAAVGDNGTAGAGAGAADRPKAQLWLNVGYSVEIPALDANGQPSGETEERFVALPVGIPLDDMKYVKILGGKSFINDQKIAQNDLLDQLLESVKDLLPGETRMVNLQLQVRRVQDQVEHTADAATNMFVRKIQF